MIRKELHDPVEKDWGEMSVVARPSWPRQKGAGLILIERVLGEFLRRKSPGIVRWARRIFRQYGGAGKHPGRGADGKSSPGMP